MSKLPSYAQHEQIRKSFWRSSRKGSQQLGESSLLQKISKAQPAKSELARSNQATPAGRSSQSSHLFKALGRSRTPQEGDDVPEPVSEQGRRKRPRPSSTSSTGAWIISATRDELVEKSPFELSDALLNLREQLKASNEQEKLDDTSGNTDDGPIQRCAQLEETLAHVRIELLEEKENSAEIEKKRKSAVKDLAMMTNFDPYFYNDNYFTERIDTFRYSVDLWVRNQSWQLARDPSNRALDGSDRYKFLSSISNHYRDYTDSKRGLESIVQAHIWRFFLQDIFGQDAWVEIKAQGTEEMLTCWELKKHFKETVPDKYIELRHEWRAASARLLKAREFEVVKQGLDNAIYELSNDMEDQLKIIAHKLDSQGLKTLIRDALELDAIMQQQRIFYKFFPNLSSSPEEKGVKFSKKTMDIVGYDGKKPLPINLQVKLVLAPGLMRYGTAAGKEYTKRSCILRAEVDLVGDITE